MFLLIDLIAAALLAALGSVTIQGEKSPVWKFRDKAGVAAVALAILIFIASLFGVDDGLRLFVHLAAVVVLLGLGLIYGFECIAGMIKIKNPVYIEEARNVVARIEDKQKLMAIIAFVLTLFMVASAFSG